MAKLGRYNSQRRKVTSLTEGTTITAADCGTIFTIGNTTASATPTHQLPAVATCRAGWWCCFVMELDTPTAVFTEIDNDASDGDNMVGHVWTVNGDNQDVQMNPTTVGTAFDKITFTENSIQGDFVHLWTDGTLWFVHGRSGGSIADCITCT